MIADKKVEVKTRFLTTHCAIFTAKNFLVDCWHSTVRDERRLSRFKMHDHERWDFNRKPIAIKLNNLEIG